MPLYEYKGFYTAGKSAGKPAKGMKEAPNKQALREALLKGGILLSQATEKSQSGSAAKGTSKPRFEIGGGITKQDVKDFTSQFCTLQKAAIPLVECLNALAEQSEKETLRTVLSDIKTKVSEGSSLAKAMADHPKVFDTLYVSMVRAGESSGALDTVLERLTDFLDSQLRLRSKIIGAMVYPIIMIVVGVMLMGLLFVFVIPRVTKLFDQQRKELPAITKVLLWTTDFLTSYRGLILLAVIGLAAYAFIKWVATPAGKLKWDTFKLKLPLLGGVIRMVSIARFAKTLATLLASGVPLLKALDILKSILGNEVLAKVIEKAHESIREGETLAAPLKRSGEFPPLMTNMIASGERAGQLEPMLNSVAVEFEKQVNVRVDAMTAMLEPLMIVVMGGTIGFVVFAILLPIMQLSDGFG